MKSELMPIVCDDSTMADVCDSSTDALAGSATEATNVNVSGGGSHNDEMDVDSNMLTQRRKTFRANALVFVTYPWATGVVMEDNLSQIFPENHYAFVSLSFVSIIEAILTSRSVVLSCPARF